MALFDWDNDGDKDIFDACFEYNLCKNKNKSKQEHCDNDDLLGFFGIILAPIWLLVLLSMIWNWVS